MKIQSQFKDYYDYVAHMYGGGDPAILYLRTRITPVKDMGHGTIFEPSKTVMIDELYSEVYYAHNAYDSEFDYKSLVICGKSYLLRSEKYKNKFIVMRDRDVPIIEKRRHCSFLSEPRKCFGVKSKKLDAVSKEIGQPIFIISHMYRNYIEVDSRIPILNEMNVASFYDAHQIYQDISHYICNVIRTSPDVTPPTVVSNEDRIVQYGFDLKQSFRHRK